MRSPILSPLPKLARDPHCTSLRRRQRVVIFIEVCLISRGYVRLYYIRRNALSASMAERFQTCKLARCKLLGFLLVEKSKNVSSPLSQLDAFAQPTGNLGQRSLNNELLDPMAERARNRLYNNLPPILRPTPIQAPNRPLFCRPRIVQILNTQKLEVTFSQPKVEPRVKVQFELGHLRA